MKHHSASSVRASVPAANVSTGRERRHGRSALPLDHREAAVDERLVNQRQQRVAIDVLFEVIGEAIERGLDLALVGEAPALRSQPVEPVTAQAIVGKEEIGRASCRERV